MIKIEKLYTSTNGHVQVEHLINEIEVFTREAHIDQQGKRTFVSAFEKIDPWEFGLEIERIKSL